MTENWFTYSEDLLPEEVKIERPFASIVRRKSMTTPQGNSASSLVSICNELIEMGFSAKMVFAALKYVAIEDTQAAADLLLKTKFGWSHSFVIVESRKDRCMICGEKFKEHLESRVEEDFEGPPRLEELFRIMPLPVFDAVTDVERWRTSVVCKICMDGLPLGHEFYLSCGHMHCRNCVSEFLTMNITNRSILDLKCPEEGCEARFTKADIRELCSKDIYQKYLDFRLDHEISMNKKLRWCPSPNCGRYVANPKGKSRVKCECGVEICFRCGEIAHKGSCKKNSDELYKVWAKGRKIQRCPICKIRIEKNEGCNHMTCTHCKYQWCWICGNEYTSSHYDGIFFGCPLLQFTNSDWSFGKILLFHFLAFILSPLLSIFCGFVFVGSHLCECISEAESCRCLLISLCTLAIIIGGPIVGVVMMLPTIGYRFYCFVKALKRACCG
eukprot:TRINITY_DN670_c0_g2_i5.p1 TRINITY_DN670_c0_g2~~TRINITY_DN670_c0_g2_i5.p1  ORF type:complete len:442 (+),score=76.24 TRINITY_DN670_c0_g2_i5:102-1427(+)